MRWWENMPEANVAIATGAASGLVVLDVDPRNGEDRSLVELERQNGRLPETLRVATGGSGRHFYFAVPKGVALKSGKLAEGLDVKADGGYVIAPPSLHPNGKRYRWEKSHARRHSRHVRTGYAPPRPSRTHKGAASAVPRRRR